MICKMRKKLRPHGVEIHTIHGAGYELIGFARDATITTAISAIERTGTRKMEARANVQSARAEDRQQQ
jgi:hypothetical protein